MCRLHPQFIKDADGNDSFVLLPAREFSELLEELEDLADVAAYDEAKAEDDGVRIPFKEAFARIEAIRSAKQQE